MASDISISIDGPTASGKTTLGATLAETLGVAFIDTGLTFRALGYATSLVPLEPSDDWRALIQHLPALPPPRARSPHGPDRQSETILVDGKDVTDDIFARNLDSSLRSVASNPAWREQIRKYHASIVGAHPRIVAVGRDVAVTLLRAARLHVALTASLAVRRERRRAQYRDYPGRSITVGSMTPRDVLNLDAIRALPHAVELDCTHVPATAVARAVLRRLERS